MLLNKQLMEQDIHILKNTEDSNNTVANHQDSMPHTQNLGQQAQADSIAAPRYYSKDCHSQILDDCIHSIKIESWRQRTLSFWNSEQQALCEISEFFDILKNDSSIEFSPHFHTRCFRRWHRLFIQLIHHVIEDRCDVFFCPEPKSKDVITYDVKTCRK